MARTGARCTPGDGGRGRSTISHDRPAKETPPPLKQVVVPPDAAEDIEMARDFYASQAPEVGEYCVDSLLADIMSFSALERDSFDPPRESVQDGQSPNG